jgi:dCTP deaminase
MWLTGNEIKKEYEAKRIFISDFQEEHLNSNSYNYRLDKTLYRLTNEIIDLKQEETYETIVIPEAGYLLLPGEAYLGSTVEVFSSDVYASLVTGRSSIGRKFITNHVTAGLIDQGFKGQITLEITVVKPTRVYAGVLFGQIFWFATQGEARLYQGKYQGQSGPTLSKLLADKNFKK